MYYVGLTRTKEYETGVDIFVGHYIYLYKCIYYVGLTRTKEYETNVDIFAGLYLYQSIYIHKWGLSIHLFIYMNRICVLPAGAALIGA